MHKLDASPRRHALEGLVPHAAPPGLQKDRGIRAALRIGLFEPRVGPVYPSFQVEAIRPR